jgi:hypothetical protein
MSDTKYNGWTNYATWRINLEVFDGLTADDICDMEGADDVALLADCCKDWVEQALSSGVPAGQSLVLDYAMAFVSDVNWREIAQHLMEASE